MSYCCIMFLAVVKKRHIFSTVDNRVVFNCNAFSFLTIVRFGWWNSTAREIKSSATQPEPDGPGRELSLLFGFWAILLHKALGPGFFSGLVLSLRHFFLLSLTTPTACLCLPWVASRYTKPRGNREKRQSVTIMLRWPCELMLSYG